MADWVASMRAGDYHAAWDLTQQDLAERDPVRRDDPALPYHLRWVWDGRSYEDRHCLVRCYHGLGDSIQFARFLPLLARRTRTLTVEVQARLRDLFVSGLDCPGVRFVAFDEAHPLPPAECDLEITELDFALRATPADAKPAYLTAKAGPLPPGSVGLCYGAGDWDRDRAVPSSLLAPLCSEARCVTLMPEATTLDVLNPSGCPFDMMETAALVAAADLVITVDTMIAHMAGAMGKPAWLLLKAEPDWRWPAGGGRTPWYPTMRIYAQPRPGDWAPVVERVRSDLAQWNAERKEG